MSSRTRIWTAALSVALITAISPLASSQVPVTLRALFDSVRNHPLARAADSRVRAAEGSRTTARALGNPILAYQVDQTPFPGAQPISMEREAMTTATIPLESFYQRGPRVARANAQVRAAESDAVLARQRLGLDAAAAYYRTALAQVQSATTRDLLGWLDSLVAYNRARVSEGVAAEADLIRSRVERDRVAAEASMGDAELAQASSALGFYVSNARSIVDLPAVELMDSPLKMPSAQRGSIDGRPDIRAARERVTASDAAVAGERSMIVRQLGATIGTMQSGHETAMIAGFSFPLPVFDQNRGEIQRAKAERGESAFELAAVERSAAADVRGAYEAARLLTDRAASLTQRDSSSFLDRADESRRIALGAYREGAVPLLQVIDAARAWADARSTYYRTLAAQHQAVLALVVAQGLDLYSTIPSLTARGDSLR